MARRKKRDPAADQIQSQSQDNRPPATDQFAVIEESGELIRYLCGHMSPLCFALDLYGTVTRMDHQGHEKPSCCGACAIERLRAAVIRCVICGHPIMPGNPIMAYEKTEGMQFERCTFIREAAPQVVVGCLDWRCRATMGVQYGYWMGTRIQLGMAPMITRIRIEGERAIFINTYPEGG